MIEEILDSEDLATGGETSGSSSALAQAQRDLAETRLALAESLEAAAFLQSVLDSSPDCIKVLTFGGDLIFMNEGGKEVMEVDDFEAIHGCSWTGFWEGDDRLAAQAALNAARAGRTAKFLGTASTAKGTRKFWDVTVARIPGGDGREDHILSISRDITAARTIEDHKDLISRELGHRIKNILSVVQAIAVQTFRDTDRPVLQRFNARLAALGAAQTLLLQTGWESVSARDLIEQTLTPMCPPDRISLEVDDVSINGRKGLSLALALHELGTNAVKYGALSNDSGTVEVSLAARADAFELTWRETGGPEITAPTHTGFGTRLMTRNLEADFGGSVQLNFNPSGLVLTLSAPL